MSELLDGFGLDELGASAVTVPLVNDAVAARSRPDDQELPEGALATETVVAVEGCWCGERHGRPPAAVRVPPPNGPTATG